MLSPTHMSCPQFSSVPQSHLTDQSLTLLICKLALDDGEVCAVSLCHSFGVLSQHLWIVRVCSGRWCSCGELLQLCCFSCIVLLGKTAAIARLAQASNQVFTLLFLRVLQHPELFVVGPRLAASADVMQPVIEKLLISKPANAAIEQWWADINSLLVKTCSATRIGLLPGARAPEQYRVPWTYFQSQRDAVTERLRGLLLNAVEMFTSCVAASLASYLAKCNEMT